MKMIEITTNKDIAMCYETEGNAVDHIVPLKQSREIQFEERCRRETRELSAYIKAQPIKGSNPEENSGLGLYLIKHAEHQRNSYCSRGLPPTLFDCRKGIYALYY